MNEPQRPDTALIEQFKRGDVRGFNELVRRYQQRVYWLVRRMVGNHDDADDITQEVFVRVYQSLKYFRAEASFYTWLYRIATNLSLNVIRKKRLKTAVDFEQLSSVPDTHVGPHDQIAQKEYELALLAAIEQLPPKQKLVFTLRYYDEMSYEDMARVLKKSVGGLKANYFHALKKIQSYVQRAIEQ